MKDVLWLIWLTTALGVVSHIQFRKGVEAVNFDRDIANIKLQNCSEVVARYRSQH